MHSGIAKVHIGDFGGFWLSMTTRIKEARQARGWSQQELAERVRVSQPTIVHWEQGTHTPRHLALMRLADALGVSRAWLQGDGTGAGSANDAKPLERINSAALSYLQRPLQHVGVYEGLLDKTDIEVCLAGARMPITYVCLPGPVTRPLAIMADDPSVRKEFPRGTIVVLDCEDNSLIESQYYLFMIDGQARLRRWRSAPARLEADTVDDTVFTPTPPDVIGRVVSSIRSY